MKIIDDIIFMGGVISVIKLFILRMVIGSGKFIFIGNSDYC